MADEANLKVNVHLANISVKDRAFLFDVVALFTDPANVWMRDQVKGGHMAIHYAPKSGAGQCRFHFLAN